SELFGHARGAFTEATEPQEGLFEAAHQGTLFLDEVGELPLALQPKLLRVLDDGVIRRVGAIETRHVDVCVFASTSRDLQAAAARVLGISRRALYRRLERYGLHTAASVI